jgi:peptidoglycan/xylan/chitin deacetylase (PgdA/CDA1 family)
VRAAAFVAAKNADSAAGMALVAEWSKQGHVVGNHTYSHPYYPNTEFGRFSEDVVKAERVLEKAPTYAKLFRFPYLKEGDTAEQRDRMRAFLGERGYRNGHVTIDASDWYVDSRLRARVEADPRASLTPYRDYYLDHVWDRAQYYDGLARRVLGRTVKHTLLVHHNVLNALYLGDLIAMFGRKGWRVVDAAEAFADPVFRAEPKIAPAGESLVWALAKESGKAVGALRYPGESDEYEKPKMDALGL